ncbi:integrase [Azotobacter beijerinckii]|uniref:Integrase n=1 Tax=Azotobacter beijerinckii TaxID=170623 RepID=A0A1H6S6R2_9GAMM|nr:tyrosine-type recombinase/integrase [Azotobacter beijerinckii]SEI63641.1 integrase [Azotobacter beijerinckii]
MARKSLDLPTGVELVGQSIRIRFMRNGKRCCETLSYPQTPQGIQAASGLRAQVIQLAKLGMLSDEKYIELFPRTSYAQDGLSPLFGEYAQTWLNSRDIVIGTRKNYLWALNIYWMPHLATTPLDQITSMKLRRIITDTEWKSPSAKRNALLRLGSVLKSAVRDELIPRNPVDSIELPRRNKKAVDPFTREEADQVITWLYENLKWQSMVYACYFEFAFYTGMRPSEIMALRWDEVDVTQQSAHVCRVVASGTVHERTKTGQSRIVLLNNRALHALEQARGIATSRAQRNLAFPESRYVFPPAKIAEHITESSTTDRYFKSALRKLGLRDRPQYNARHTYATMCLMAGMNPAFIATQLGHSVQMLLSTYARWINSSTDWHELDKLDKAPEKSQIGTKVVQLKSTTL